MLRFIQILKGIKKLCQERNQKQILPAHKIIPKSNYKIKLEKRSKISDLETNITIQFHKNMDWVDGLLKKSCNKTLTKEEVLHSLFHMIEVNEKTLNHIQSNKAEFGPELEQLKQTEIRDLEFHLKYYRSLVNYISAMPESKVV